ncbi:MAG: glycosyltransferase, partial [Bacteroidaceae bacterium]|nr:glycosyltransferase [Bacteroidaceae bacterium]
MEHATTLTIIVPVYNVAQHLRQCLVSLSEQMEGDDYEVLLVNDASTDNSRGICSTWCDTHPRFRLLCHAANQGLSAARNTGLQAAAGTYIAFADSDDFLAPLTLQRALRAMGDADVVEFP